MEKRPTEHRRLAEMHKQLYPSVNTDLTPIPSQWTIKEPQNRLELSGGNLIVAYIGKGQSDTDAASIKTAHPIPAACGVFYFEITVEDKGADGYIGIGLSAGGALNNKLPGWEKNSYGYHGDDGHVFKGTGTGQEYGPTYGTGDVIGCCLNLADGTVFYTKNGVHLGQAFSGLQNQKMYPVVGLRSVGEIVKANFGQTSFQFDIHSYIQEVKANTLATVRSLPASQWLGVLGQDDMASDNDASPAALNELIVQYLAHQGYSGTAEIFARQTGVATGEDLASVVNRQRIISLVQAGRIDEGMQLTNQFYAHVLSGNPGLTFMLKRQRFIEMVKDGGEHLSDAKVLTEILDYGRQLQADSSHAGLLSDERKRSLEEAFSLLAYKNPTASPLAYLLNQDGRDLIAQQLNTAILESLGLPRMSALELVIRQAQACIDAAMQNDVGAAAFVNLRDLL